MKQISVWIVEDNGADAFLIEMALQRTGLQYEKTLIRDGESAIEMIRACRTGAVPVPDVLLLDISLPRFDGTEVLRVLRETSLFDRVGIAIVSSSPMVTGGFGVKRYLQKPSTLEQFLERVSRTVMELLPGKSTGAIGAQTGRA